MISGYPTVFALGHRAITGIFDGPVLVEEKIDGSQFSFALIDDMQYARSKKQQLWPDTPSAGGMFERGLETVKGLDLHPGWIYRGEYLQRPAHNTLCYGRVPEGFIILYDIETEPGTFLTYTDKMAEGQRLGLEVVPILYEGVVSDIDTFKEFLERDSCLGLAKIEGVVVKNYNCWTFEKKVAIGKYVSEAYKETNKQTWADRGMSVVDLLVSELKTEARWAKTVQHLRDEGKLEGSPRDIGSLIKELSVDLRAEEGDYIHGKLWHKFWPQVNRGVQAGFAEWYKEQLLEAQFESDD